MTKDLSSLVDDIYSVLSDQTDHEVSEDNVHDAGELFKQVLRTRFTRREERSGDEVLRFSSLGKKDRMLWYESRQTPKEQMPPSTLFKFLFGDMIEIAMIFLAKEAGHEVTHEQHEVERDGVKGHIDCIIDGVTVDVKSASSYSFQKFKSGEFKFDDPFGYISQLSGYCNELGGDRGAFLVADKVSGNICLAEIDKRDIDGNRPGPRIEHLRAVIGEPNPPPRCYPDVEEGKSGNKKLGIGCSYCSFKDVCWADANGGKGLRKYYYSRGPVWLTNVDKEPRVEEAF